MNEPASVLPSLTQYQFQEPVMGSERERELRRRRKRLKSVTAIKKKSEKATAAEKEVLAAKLRRMSPGGELIVASLGLETK
jgi:hypothetical protein